MVKKRRWEDGCGYIVKDIENATELCTSGITNKVLDLLVNCSKLQSLKLNRSEEPIDLLKISHLTNLIELNINNCKVNDFSSLEKLNNLIILDIKRCEFNNFKIFAKLEKLEFLDLSNNNIESIPGNLSIPSLDLIYLNKNKLKDLEFLRGLSNLKDAYLNGNSISDITPLVSLANLNIIEVSNNKIDSIDKLGALNELKDLTADRNKIKNITIELFERLEHFAINNNPIFDGADIFNLTEIVEIVLEDKAQAIKKSITLDSNSKDFQCVVRLLEKYQKGKGWINIRWGAGCSEEMHIKWNNTILRKSGPSLYLHNGRFKGQYTKNIKPEDMEAFSILDDIISNE